MGLFDRRMRRIAGGLVKRICRKPSDALQPAHIQSLMIIQPVNMLPDGRQDMCDSCPDITVHEGKLVWSCRLEEMNQFGTFVQSVPKEKVG
jgi:hypothetical protein